MQLQENSIWWTLKISETAINYALVKAVTMLCVWHGGIEPVI